MGKNGFAKKRKVGKQGGGARNNGIGRGRAVNNIGGKRRLMLRKKMVKEAKTYDAVSMECKEEELEADVDEGRAIVSEMEVVKKRKGKNGLLAHERAKSMPFVLDDDGIDIEVSALTKAI